MNSGDWLVKASKTLDTAGIGTARLDALVLLEDVTGKDRGYLLANPESQISSSNLSRLTNLLNKRITHLPLAYVRGKTEFYGRTFTITPAVLEPRPESETMIELLKNILSDKDKKYSQLMTDKRLALADIGSGSGALGITAKLELQNLQVDLIEIDKKALNISKSNVDLFTLNIRTIENNLLTNSNKPYDILLCNLPYVPDDHTINRAAMHEPSFAIFGGPDGLDLYRKLFFQVKNQTSKPLLIFTESLLPQHVVLDTIAQKHGYHLIDEEDFIQVFELSA